MTLLPRPLALEAKIWMFGGLIAIAAAVLYWTLALELAVEPSPVEVPWWVVAAGFTAAQCWVVHLHSRRGTHSLTLVELPLVVGLLFLEPTELLAASVVGSSLALLLDREIPLLKRFFNAARFTLGACAGLLALHAFGIGRDPLEPAVWLAVFGAVSASALVAEVCVGIAVRMGEGAARRRFDTLVGTWIVALGTTSLGLAAAAVVTASPEAGLLLLPPTAVLLLAYRAYVGERRRTAELGFLYEATRTLSRSSEMRPELEELLERTAEAFRVTAVELVLFSAEPRRSARSSLARDGDRRMLEPLDEALADRLRGMAGELHGPLDVRTSQDLMLRGYFRAREMKTGMVAPLRSEGCCVGLFLVAGRESVDGGFTEEDLRLLGTLAGNITEALQDDRIDEAVQQLESLQNELERKTLYDSLTQLANRSLFHNRLEHALRSGRAGTSGLLLRDAVRRRRALSRELERAISDHELTVVYQPVVRLRDGHPVALEALVRWNHPERGQVPPGDFIAFAEETGAVVQIGEIVLERVAEQAAKVGIPIHVNVSAPELTAPGFLARVDELVVSHGFAPGLLVFEVTERLFVGEDPALVAVLEGLKERGMRVAMDDFGTGYSSLAYLSRLPVDTLKIPKDFVDEVTGPPEQHSLARAVIELGATLDLTVVAEGIEHPGQIAALRAFGCEYGQGYHYGLPTDAQVALSRVDLLSQAAAA